MSFFKDYPPGVYNSIHPVTDKRDYFRKWTGESWYTGGSTMTAALNSRYRINGDFLEEEKAEGYAITLVADLDGNPISPAPSQVQLDLF